MHNISDVIQKLRNLMEAHGNMRVSIRLENGLTIGQFEIVHHPEYLEPEVSLELKQRSRK